MTTQAHGFGTVLEQASERMRAIAAVVLAVGLLTAIVTESSVPAMVTKALLVAMVVPTVVLALGLTRPSES